MACLRLVGTKPLVSERLKIWESGLAMFGSVFLAIPGSISSGPALLPSFKMFVRSMMSSVVTGDRKMEFEIRCLRNEEGLMLVGGI